MMQQDQDILDILDIPGAMKMNVRIVVLAMLLLTGLTGAALAQQPLPAEMRAAQHRCELSSDRRLVSVSVTNPSATVSECTVNCYLPYKGGVAAITCTRVIAGNAVSAPLCAHSRDNDGQYAKLDRSDARCAVAATPAAPPGMKLVPESATIAEPRKLPEEMSQEERQLDHLFKWNKKH